MACGFRRSIACQVRTWGLAEETPAEPRTPKPFHCCGPVLNQRGAGSDKTLFLPLLPSGLEMFQLLRQTRWRVWHAAQISFQHEK